MQRVVSLSLSLPLLYFEADRRIVALCEGRGAIAESSRFRSRVLFLLIDYRVKKKRMENEDAV